MPSTDEKETGALSFGERARQESLKKKEARWSKKPKVAARKVKKVGSQVDRRQKRLSRSQDRLDIAERALAKAEGRGDNLAVNPYSAPGEGAEGAESGRDVAPGEDEDVPQPKNPDLFEFVPYKKKGELYWQVAKDPYMYAMDDSGDVRIVERGDVGDTEPRAVGPVEKFSNAYDAIIDQLTTTLSGRPWKKYKIYQAQADEAKRKAKAGGGAKVDDDTPDDEPDDAKVDEGTPPKDPESGDPAPAGGYWGPRTSPADADTDEAVDDDGLPLWPIGIAAAGTYAGVKMAGKGAALAGAGGRAAKSAVSGAAGIAGAVGRAVTGAFSGASRLPRPAHLAMNVVGNLTSSGSPKAPFRMGGSAATPTPPSGPTPTPTPTPTPAPTPPPTMVQPTRKPTWTPPVTDPASIQAAREAAAQTATQGGLFPGAKDIADLDADEQAINALRGATETAEDKALAAAKGAKARGPSMTWLTQLAKWGGDYRIDDIERVNEWLNNLDAGDVVREEISPRELDVQEMYTDPFSSKAPVSAQKAAETAIRKDSIGRKLAALMGKIPEELRSLADIVGRRGQRRPSDRPIGELVGDFPQAAKEGLKGVEDPDTALKKLQVGPDGPTHPSRTYAINRLDGRFDRSIPDKGSTARNVAEDAARWAGFHPGKLVEEGGPYKELVSMVEKHGLEPMMKALEQHWKKTGASAEIIGRWAHEMRESMSRNLGKLPTPKLTKFLPAALGAGAGMAVSGPALAADILMSPGELGEGTPPSKWTTTPGYGEAEAYAPDTSRGPSVMREAAAPFGLPEPRVWRAQQEVRNDMMSLIAAVDVLGRPIDQAALSEFSELQDALIGYARTAGSDESPEALAEIMDYLVGSDILTPELRDALLGG